MSTTIKPPAPVPVLPVAAHASNRKLAVTIGKNAISLVALNGAQVVTRLITVPIIIAHLGLGGYGIWSIIMASGSYMRFGSAGLKSAFQKYVAEATGDASFDRASRLLSTGAAVMTILSIVGLVPMALLSRKMAVAMGVPGQFLTSTAHSIMILAFIMIISNIGGAYESIVAGGHRIDLVATFGIVMTVAESVAIVICMYAGYGLLSMTVVMAVSEFFRVLCCYVASSRIVPEVHLSVHYLCRKVLPELARFAGTFQLVNVLEVGYMSIVPITALKLFGANAAGAYALSDRIVSVALMAQEALLLPLLSGGTMVYASGSAERMQLLIKKAFKVAFSFSIPLLAFVAAFGSTILLAWTGQAGSVLRTGIWILCVAGFFKCISRVALIFYRATGGAVMDLVREIVRIAAVMIAVLLGHKVGYYGILGGLGFAEFIGLICMVVPLNRIRGFHASMVLSDMGKLTIATAGIIAMGLLVAYAPVPWATGERWIALIRLLEVSATCLLLAWPALTLTRFLNESERRTVIDVLLHFPRGAASEA